MDPLGEEIPCLIHSLPLDGLLIFLPPPIMDEALFCLHHQKEIAPLLPSLWEEATLHIPVLVGDKYHHQIFQSFTLSEITHRKQWHPPTQTYHSWKV